MGGAQIDEKRINTFPVFKMSLQDCGLCSLLANIYHITRKYSFREHLLL